jgi:hypothetical protein
MFFKTSVLAPLLPKPFDACMISISAMRLEF